MVPSFVGDVHATLHLIQAVLWAEAPHPAFFFNAVEFFTILELF
jgi:hypothetical protein